MYDLAVYVKEGLLLAGTYLQKTLRILTYVFDQLYFTQCLIQVGGGGGVEPAGGQEMKTFSSIF